MERKATGGVQQTAKRGIDFNIWKGSSVKLCKLLCTERIDNNV